MQKFSRTDFKELFRGKYDHAKWIDAMCAVFGPLQLKKNPEELEIGLKDKDCGWYLGRFTAASHGGDMEVGVFRYRIDSKSVLKSRVGLRNLVRPYVRDYSSLGAALVVFEDAKTGDWRFSFVSDLKGGETAAKRYTYVFGDADGVYNTPADRFLKLAECRPADGFVTFEQMREAFSVEALSKEFYNRLFAWYQWAMDEERIHVTFPNKVGDLLDDRKDLNVAMIRLLTRILFCWFIKQKKLVPDELFDVEYLKGILQAFEYEKHEEFDPLSETQGTYYNAILQNLFFATLNREIIDDDGKRRAFANAKSARDVRNLYRYREMFKFASGEVEKKIIALFAKVPFLNGGLFECLDKFKKFDLMQDDDEYLDGFSRNYTSCKVGSHRHYRYIAHVPNVLFFSEDEKELGLINLLKAYNFTIEENASNDAEVSLDPELLGRVFENLLADYNEETHKSARNATGSFYTPREIVDYQVAESLCAYLTEATGAEASVVRDYVIHRVKPAETELCRQLEESLLKVRILDPACGSGAYPMGCLLKIVDLVDCLKDGKCDHYKLKLKLIDKAIYGIDIQPIAMLITKLRFFISLICDQKEITDDETTNFGVKPLPNLETKFVAANSLVSLAELKTDELLNDEDPVVKDLRVKLLEIREKHFAASTTRQKKTLRNQDEVIREKMIKRLTDIASKPDMQKLALYKQELARLEKTLGDLDVNGFVVKPSVEQTTFFDEPEVPKKAVQTELPFSAAYEKRKKELNKQIKDICKKISVEEGRKMTAALKADAENLARWHPYSQNDVAGFFDPYWMFGLKTGFDIVIGNPPYISAPDQLKVEKLRLQRDYLAKSKRFECLVQKWDLYIAFIELSLKYLLRDGGVFTMIVPYPLTNQTYAAKLRQMLLTRYALVELVDLQGVKVFESATVTNCIPIVIKSEPVEKVWISHANEKRQIARVFEQSVADLMPDKKTLVWNTSREKKNVNRHADLHVLGDYCYISVGMVLNADEKTAKGEFTKDDLISEVRDKVHPRAYIEAKDISRYSINRVRYLEYGTERCPGKLRRQTFPELYNVEKLLVNCLGSLCVAYDNKYHTHNHSIYAVARWNEFLGVENKSIAMSVKRYSAHSRREMERISETISLKYLLGVMNSRYFSALLEVARGGDYHIMPEYIRNIPIPAASAEQQREVSDLVDHILAAKKADPNADTSALESEIDQLVYRLYDLTPEEIAVVEGKGN